MIATLLPGGLAFGQQQGSNDPQPTSVIKNFGTDSIDLTNLSVYLNVPIRFKPGVIPFNYSLEIVSNCGGIDEYDLHGFLCGVSANKNGTPNVYTENQPIPFPPTAPTGILGGYFYLTYTAYPEFCQVNGSNGEAYYNLEDWAVVEADGETHPLSTLNGNYVIPTLICGANTGTGTPNTGGGFTTVTSDNSGFTIVVSIQSNAALSSAVYSRR